MKIDFTSAKEREMALANFESLLKHPGWILVAEIVNANIEFLKNQIIDGTGEGETKEYIDRLRDKLKIHKEVINTPNYWIEKLQPVEPVTHNQDDPFNFVGEKPKK